MSDHCNSSNNPNPYMVVAATLGVAKIVHDVSGHTIGPITGHQYTVAGSEYMDSTMSLLREKKEGSQEYVINPHDRGTYLSRHQRLQPEMYRLQEETMTYLGSAKNWSAGHNFHHAAKGLARTTKSSSDMELAIYGQAQAEAELQQHRSERHDIIPDNRSSVNSHESRRNRKRRQGNEDNNTVEDSGSGSTGSGSGSEHPWEDDRSSVYVSCRSRASESLQDQSQYGSNESVHRPHRPQYYPPQGAQPQPSYSGYPQAGSSSQYSPYTASYGYPPTGRY